MYKSYDDKYINTAKKIYLGAGICDPISCDNCFTGYNNVNNNNNKSEYKASCILVGNASGKTGSDKKDETLAKAAEDFLEEAGVDIGINISKLTMEQFLQLAEDRAAWGHEKYGDADKYRNASLDCIEELADIKNILNRRMLHLTNDYLNVSDEIVESVEIINRQITIMFELIQRFDDTLRQYNIKISDRNGGPRIGIKKLLK